MRPGAESGRVALVVGANRGLGAAIAERLVRDGFRVAGTHRGRHPDVDEVTWVRADVGDTASIDEAFAQVEAALGPVEVLVVSAGITRDGLAVRMTDDDFGTVIDTDLTGAFRCARRAIPRMMRARFGRIIFIGSMAGALGNPGQANYSAAKAGLVGMAHALARELAPRNLCVNVVAPGPIRSDMTGELTPDQQTALRSIVPMGRLGEPHEVAAAVSFLAADDAGFVSGATIAVDGGVGIT